MADNMSKENRSKTMKAIRSQSKLENRITKALWNRGYRFRKNDKSLFGKPDISIKKYKIVIFVDSCFWHVCPLHSNVPKSNKDYWIRKLKRNEERDALVTAYYLEKGWHIRRIWEHEIKDDFYAVIDNIMKFIDAQKNK